MRPRSIRLFEALFLAALALTVVAAVAIWPMMMEQARAQAGPAHLSDGAIRGIVAGGTAVGVAIMALLWFFVARQGSAVAKWLVVLFAAYSTYGSVTAIRSGATLDLAAVLSLFTTVLLVAAAAFLFAPDTRPWFAGNPEPSV